MTAWVLALMLVLQPRAPWVDSYQDTARAIADVTAEEAPLFAGHLGREKTAALLVAVAWFESTFRPDAVGDKGAAKSLYQVHGPTPSDAHQATREALAMMRASFRACRALPLEERLAWYASGREDGCSSDAGRRASRHRVGLALRLFSKHAPP